MSGIRLAQVNKIITGAFAQGEERGLQPFGVAVLDARGGVGGASVSSAT